MKQNLPQPEDDQTYTEKRIFYNIQFTANEHSISIYFNIWKNYQWHSSRQGCLVQKKKKKKFSTS